MKPDEFIAAIAPAAIESMHASKVPASFTIAQAALESGWGSSQLAQQGHNLFGVKADKSWHGDVLTMQTREFLHGAWVMVPALWRRYANWFEAIEDHAAFFHTNPRYKAAFDTTDGEAFTRAVALAGYATDPAYAQKVIATMRAHQMSRFDSTLPPENPDV